MLKPNRSMEFFSVLNRLRKGYNSQSYALLCVPIGEIFPLSMWKQEVMDIVSSRHRLKQKHVSVQQEKVQVLLLSVPFCPSDSCFSQFLSCFQKGMEQHKIPYLSQTAIELDRNFIKTRFNQNYEKLSEVRVKPKNLLLLSGPFSS